MKRLPLLLSVLLWGPLLAMLLGLPVPWGLLLLFLGCCLFPGALYTARQRLGYADPDGVAPRPPRPPVPAEALTEENLRRVFGEQNVARAWAPRLGQEPAPAQALERLGGSPVFVRPVEWPRCRQCGHPLTFVAQLAVGPERPLRYPEEGLLYVFVCQWLDMSRVGGECCPSGDGAESCFVQGLAGAGPGVLTRSPGEPQPSGGEAMESWQAHPSVRLPARVLGTPEQYALLAEVLGPLAFQVGGLADWVQGEASPGPCPCGAERELVLQFNEVTPELNLASGRAYVFACRQRHAPDALWLLWQAC